MGLRSELFKYSAVIFTFLLPADGRGESFDFYNSFLVSTGDCNLNEYERSLLEKASRSSFIAIGDFGADIDMEYAGRTCRDASSDPRAEVAHKQLLDCRTKQNFLLQCRSYVLCRSQNYAPRLENGCRSFAAGVDTASVELTRALYGDRGKNWSIANLLFSALLFHKDMIPEDNEGTMLRWMSSVDLSDPTSTRSLLIALGIVLQRPRSLDKKEVQRLAAYNKDSDGANADRYIEPDDVTRLSNASLERIVLELFIRTIPDGWMLPQ